MFLKTQLIPVKDFKQILRNLHNRLYGGGPIKTESLLAKEVAKLVLCKVKDEVSLNKEVQFFITPTEFKTQEGREQAYKRILSIFQEKTEFALGSYWVAEVINSIQKYSLHDNKSYVSPLADVYEIFNSGEFKGGRGQFFTPPVIVNLAFDILSPTFNDLVIDPACGSGNFISKVITKFCAPDSPDYVSDKVKREKFIQTKVYGRDIESDLIRVANEYIEIIAGGNSNICLGDSLDILAGHYDKMPFGAFTKIFTNPPFGTNIQVTNPKILELYDLGHQLEDGVPAKQLAKGQDPDRLFLELCVKLLKKGGEAAIVLPRQILSGEEPNAVEVRKWLLRNVTILSVIDLPPNTFQPHTGTITSLLVFKKGLAKELPPVFFAVCENVGHDRRGLPLYQLDVDGEVIIDNTGETTLYDDTPYIAKTWKEYVQFGKIKNPSWNGFLVETEKIFSSHLKLLNAWAYNPDASDAYIQVMKLAEKEDIQEVVPLREICKSIFVPGRHKRKYVEETETSIPFLSTTQIFHIHDIDYKYQPHSFAASQGLLVEENWILITRSGSTGRVRYVNKELGQYAVSDHCIRIIPDESRVDSGYLYAFLSSKVGQLLIDQGRYASVIETISHTRIGEIPIPLPPLKKQKTIGDLIRKSEEARVQANLLRKEALDSLNKKLE